MWITRDAEDLMRRLGSREDTLLKGLVICKIKDDFFISKQIKASNGIKIDL